MTGRGAGRSPLPLRGRRLRGTGSYDVSHSL